MIFQPPYIYALDPNIFYNDLPEDEQKHWFSLIKSHALGTFTDTTPAASWKEVCPYHYSSPYTQSSLLPSTFIKFNLQQILTSHNLLVDPNFVLAL